MANVFQYSKSELAEFVKSVSAELLAAKNAEEAVPVLKKALERYTIFDLQRVGGTIRRETELLPEPYRSRYRPYSIDLLNQYHAFLSDVRSGKSKQREILDRKLWDEFWKNAEESCFSDEVSKNSQEVGIGTPAGKLFYRLVYGYAMLIAGLPGHPIGMPFPGGWTVKEENGKILCPIRDKEKDLPQALCNYCPALQDESCL